uniref:hypothetical protein n=1 Tax=Stutzerimonas kunmingensis TaxID=1211807 RepID=UPI002FC7A04C
EVVECTAFLNDPIGMPDACKPNSGGWIVMPAYFDAGETLANGYRYRARPAGELVEPSVDWKATAEVARAALATQAAEIDALRASCEGLLASQQNAMKVAEAAEARAARLSTQVDALLAHCPDGECWECSRIICPEASPHHFHHDGCPACEARAALGPGGGA